MKSWRRGFEFLEFRNLNHLTPFTSETINSRHPLEMKTKPTRSLLLGTTVALLLLLLSMWIFIEPSRWFQKTSISSNEHTLTKQSIPQTSKKVVASDTDKYLPPPHVASAFIGSMNAPIEFYGQVIDQHGQPVEGASVLISANNKAWGKGERHEITTDPQGLFFIKGIRGLSAFVQVSKKDYYQVSSLNSQSGSQGTFAYGSNLGKGIHQPDESNPVRFRLYKIGEIEPLIHQKRRTWKVSKDGTILKLPLEPQAAQSVHYLEVQCWSDDAVEDDGVRHHNWRFKISVPNGGLLRRPDPLAFEAPVEGYKNSEEFGMPSSLPEMDWKDEISIDYFVRFNDGVFGRFQVDMLARGRHSVQLESHLNPKVGSRNLTADPDKHY